MYWVVITFYALGLVLKTPFSIVVPERVEAREGGGIDWGGGYWWETTVIEQQ